VDGGGYTISVLLLNTSNEQESGLLQVLDDNGTPLVVSQVGGTTGPSFRYSIPPNGACRFQTDGSPASVKAGWLRLSPDPNGSAPVGSGVFGYNPGGMLISESGIPTAASTYHVQVYVDLSANHDAALAIANLSQRAGLHLNPGFPN
jgi:hypothetical protein